MSLLNDMLRDISQKHQVPDGSEGYDYSLLQSTSMARRKRKNLPKELLASLLIFVLVFATVVAVNYARHHQKKPVATVNVSTASGVKSQIGVAGEASLQQQGFKQQASAIPLLVKHENTAVQSQIDELLRQAERAISMDRLTSPIEDNAYGYYQKIIILSPDNEQAKQGLENIAARYLAKAQEQQQLGNSQQTEALIQRAKFVAPDFVREQLSVQMAPVINLPAEDSASGITTARPPQESTAPGSAQVATAEKIKPINEPAEIHESVKSFKVAEAERLDVTPNPEWKDEDTSRQARDLIQQGKSAEAAALLKKFMVSEAAPVKSAALLLDIYLQQANYDAIEIVLAHAPYLPLATSTRYQAQMLSAQGNNADAIRLLEKNLSDAEKDEDYRALLASLYHKTGNYRQSVLNYQRLLNNFGEKPAYWLGLALAYDGLSQPKNALQAYLHLREFAQLQPQVSSYIDQRIAALRSQ